MDNQKHISATGIGNKNILKNLEETVTQIKKHSLSCQILIRTPLIPGYTDSNENLIAINNYLFQLSQQKKLDKSKTIIGWELCGFNHLAIDKYRQQGLPWKIENRLPLTQQEANRLLEISCKGPYPKSEIQFSGLTTN